MDINLERDQEKLIKHCNVVGTVTKQEQLGPNLWAVTLNFGLLADLFGKTPSRRVYFDQQIMFKLDKKAPTTEGFQIIIRHAYSCRNPERKFFIHIAAVAILERNGRQQSFKAACYSGR